MAKEASYYPAVREYLTHLGYFCGDLKKGLGTLGVHADVIGARDRAHEYSSEKSSRQTRVFHEIPEIVAEVKMSIDTKVLTQAARLAVYADYCYFALAEDSYTQTAIEVAESMGIGLLLVRGGPQHAKVLPIREAERKSPREDFRDRLLYSSFGFSRCAICRSYTREELGFTFGLHRKSELNQNRRISVIVCASCLEGLIRAITQDGVYSGVNFTAIRKKMSKGAKELGLEFVG